MLYLPNTPMLKSRGDPPSSAFKASRLTETTFLIKEFDDIWREHPHIYAKVVESAETILIIDTGCGGRNDSNADITKLREFIEAISIEDNGGKPLNPGGQMKYLVVTSHCHYDHILGVEQFSDSPILASSHSPSFIDPSNLPENSLCNNYDIGTPFYTPILVPNMHEIFAKLPDGTQVPLDILVLHTPGHTPDELALYDAREMMLYVGDTIYEHEPIIFPKEGSIVDWFTSMDFLISFVEAKESAGAPQRGPGSLANCVLINAGHRTVVRPALEVLRGALAFVQRVVNGTERVRLRLQVRGEETVVYQQDDAVFSLSSPRRLVREAKQVLGGR